MGLLTSLTLEDFESPGHISRKNRGEGVSGDRSEEWRLN